MNIEKAAFDNPDDDDDEFTTFLKNCFNPETTGDNLRHKRPRVGLAENSGDNEQSSSELQNIHG